MTNRSRPLELYARSVTRSTVVYALGLAAIVPFGIAQIAVTTRFLPPAEFGRLAVLFAIAAALTLLCNLGSLQGTTMWVYGLAEGGEDGGGDLLGETAEAPVGEKRRIMGSGLLLTLATSGVVAVGAMAIASPIAALLLGDSGYAGEVRWAVVSAVVGAPWRLMIQVFRFERRATAFSVISAVRPAVVVALIAAALAAGSGVSGVVAATAVGTVLATLVAGAASWRNYALAPRWSDVPEIYRRGSRFVPLTMTMYVQSNADVLILSQTVSAGDVGLYRAASRIAQFPQYVTHAFLMAWPTLENSPVARASREVKGHDAFASVLYTYLLILTCGLLVLVVVGAEALIRIAAPSYRPASNLIPFVAAAFAAHIVFYGLFRASLFERRLSWFATLSAAGGAVYVGTGAPLVDLAGTYGIAIASAGASLLSAGALLWVNARSERPLPVQWRRLITAVATAAAVIAFEALSPVGGLAHIAWAAVGVIGFVAALLAFDVVPAQQLKGLLFIAQALLPDAGRRRRMLRRLAEIPDSERESVLRLVGPGATASVAIEPLAHARLVRGLRHLDGRREHHHLDHIVGQWLLAEYTTVERDDEALRLERAGLDPLELHELEGTFNLLRSARRRAWRRHVPVGRVT